jgi:hypothetical protein
VQRLIELAELDRIDERGNLIPLSELPDADRRVIAVAANALLDRAFGKPKEPPSDPEHESRYIERKIDWGSFSDEEIAAIEAFAVAAQKRKQIERGARPELETDR